MATNTFNQNSSKTKRFADAGQEDYRRHFRTCISAGDVDKVREYCETYAEALTFTGFDDDKGTALHYAAEVGQLAVIEYMISQGADIHARDRAGDTPAHTAANMRKEMAALRLVEAGTPPDMLMLAYAGYHGEPMLAKRVLDGGVSPNAVGNYGASMLMKAASGSPKKGSVEVVQLLIERGADVLHKNEDGKTALTYALDSHNWDAAVVLEKEMRKAQAKLDASTVLQKNMTVSSPLKLK